MPAARFVPMSMCIHFFVLVLLYSTLTSPPPLREKASCILSIFFFNSPIKCPLTTFNLVHFSYSLAWPSITIPYFSIVKHELIILGTGCLPISSGRAKLPIPFPTLPYHPSHKLTHLLSFPRHPVVTTPTPFLLHSPPFHLSFTPRIHIQSHELILADYFYLIALWIRYFKASLTFMITMRQVFFPFFNHIH